MSVQLKIRKELAKINPYTPGKPIEEVKRLLGLEEVYKLASNEIPFPPLYIKKSIMEELYNINRYPEASCFYLRREIAKRNDIDQEQVVFGNGSDEIITLTLRAFIDAGDEVVIAYPTFLMYEIQAIACGAQVVKVPLKNYRYSLVDVAASITEKTKVIFIANPDNPTGTYVTHVQLEEFLSKISRDIVVYLDEAYFEFAPGDFPRSLEFLKKRGNIIVARTFSKVYGLAGLRVGYCMTTKEIAVAFNTIRDPFNINRFAQVAALAGLKNKAFLKKVTSLVAKEKKYLYTEFTKLGITFVESATNFILVNFKADARALCEYL
ncbi:MAG: histidinol-phosphate transaminase, partial [Candidatus Omnitrophica bacterium]|nr:histidinol-phosphate transaminase [Candidatus Omnitrophota bacterium]